MFDWSHHILFQRVLLDLQLYRRSSLDPRYVTRLLSQKVSDICILSMGRMPNGDIIVDANKRATILKEKDFETVAELEPNDAQMVSVGM